VATYITHFCANKQCNNGWIDEDVKRSGAPPTWKLCRSCAGDAFDSQKPVVDASLSRRLKEAARLRHQAKTA
jgi:hypothetical protein